MSSFPSRIIDNTIHETNGMYTNHGQNASGQGLIINYHNYQPASPLDDLEKHCSLWAAFDSAARFDAPRCPESTRLGITQILEKWIDDDGDNSVPSSLFWLYGTAGVGKSALAQSLSEKYHEKKQLAASFFFCRSDATRNNGEYLIPTLVSHFVDHFEGIRPFVEDRVRKNRYFFVKVYWTQIRELLIEPLLALKSTGTPVTQPRLIVIDGLDECENSLIRCELLRVIGRAIPQIPYPLRFLVTSRPEACIAHVFNHELQAVTARQYNLSDGSDGPVLQAVMNVGATEKLEEMRPPRPPPPICIPSSKKPIARRRRSWSSPERSPPPIPLTTDETRPLPFPICLPSSSKPRRRLSWSNSERSRSPPPTPIVVLPPSLSPSYSQRRLSWSSPERSPSPKLEEARRPPSKPRRRLSWSSPERSPSPKLEETRRPVPKPRRRLSWSSPDRSPSPIPLTTKEARPPPPPPICFPFSGKPRGRQALREQQILHWEHNTQIARHQSYSATSMKTSHADSLTFHSDSELYDEVVPKHSKDDNGRLGRLNMMAGTNLPKWGRGVGKDKEKGRRTDVGDNEKLTGVKKLTALSKWEWGVDKKEKGKGIDNESSSFAQAPLYLPVVRRDSKSSPQSKASARSKETQRTATQTHQSAPKPILIMTLDHHDSTSTLVGSALERKIDDCEFIHGKADTTERLEEMRRLMLRDNLDYYIVPSKDPHGMKFVASSDKRCEFISGFTGFAGDAIITKNSAYLVVDARYCVQAENEIDDNWTLVRAGAPRDWIEWLSGHAKDSRIGVDARMISHEEAVLIKSKIDPKTSKLIYPPQNLVDLIWKDKPGKSLEKIHTQSVEFTGIGAPAKLAKLREWIRQQPPDKPHPNKTTGPMDAPVATLVTALNCIAYILNLRGSDIPFNPLFHAYLFVGIDRAILFVESQKLEPEVVDHLKVLGVEQRGYTDVWPFLRRREWGEGRVLVTPETSYALTLMLTHFRYTIAPSYIEPMMSIKNETEIESLRRAYLRDGVSFVRFLAWLENKLTKYDITEYEAAQIATEYRRKNKHFTGLAYEIISASGSNAALPHYSPKRRTAAMISRDLPYLIDSGAHYLDGTCSSTRTVHFGRATPEMCEAYTRVLQGHIAIDSATFPEGISGRQLGIFARKAFWKDGLNDIQSMGHGFGAFLTVLKGPHASSSDAPLVPGRVITNESGLYSEGQWGMRIESLLVVRRVKTTGQFIGDNSLGFERFTCVPIQTRMVNESMLTKEEKAWIKDHNQRCYDKIAPFIKDEQRALKWLKREAQRGIGLAPADIIREFLRIG